MAVDLASVAAADFQPHVRSLFRMEADGPLQLTLMSVNERPGPGTRRQPFSLLFLGPADPVLPQRIYRLEHDVLGLLEIFLVPIGRDEDGTTYEAVFA